MVRTSRNQTVQAGVCDLNSAAAHEDNGQPSRGGGLVLRASLLHLGDGCVPEDLWARQIFLNQII